MKIAATSPGVVLGECQTNREIIQKEIDHFAARGVTHLVLPPLCLTGFTCGQLFTFPFFLDRQWQALQALQVPPGLTCVTTVMTEDGERLYAFDREGECSLESLEQQGLHPCLHIEDASEKCWNLMPFAHQWTVGSIDRFLHRLRHRRVVFASCGAGESTASRVFSGSCGAIQDQQALLRQNDRIVLEPGNCEAFRPISRSNAFEDPRQPFVPSHSRYLQEAVDILCAALRRRLKHLGNDRVVLGISGGLDSALSLLLCHQTIPNKKDITGLTLPGFGTSQRTESNAQTLMEALGVSARRISIVPAVQSHLQAIGHPQELQDVTYENAQARERMQILFDYANQIGGIVIGSSDMSEAMLGFTTFGGDNMSMYNPLGGLPKTLVRALLVHFGQLYPDLTALLTDILQTPISPELLPGSQNTEEILGDYLYHDFYMYHTVVSRMGRAELEDLFASTFGHPAQHLDTFYRRMTAAQFKRNCSPESPQVLQVKLSKKYFNLPSDIRNVF